MSMRNDIEDIRVRYMGEDPEPVLNLCDEIEQLRSELHRTQTRLGDSYRKLMRERAENHRQVAFLKSKLALVKEYLPDPACKKCGGSGSYEPSDEMPMFACSCTKPTPFLRTIYGDLSPADGGPPLKDGEKVGAIIQRSSGDEDD